MQKSLSKQKSGNKHMLQRKIYALLVIASFILFLSASTCFTADFKLLITGFEPFGEYKKNPTEELVKFINQPNTKNYVSNAKIKAITLPVEYQKSWTILQKTLNEYQPDFIISLGFAPGSDKIKLEAIAENHSGGFSDNKGIKHYGPIIKGRPSYYSTGFPIHEIKSILLENGVPAEISKDAGGYLCNYIFYHIMNYSQSMPEVKAGFIHVPDLPVHGDKGLWKALQIIINSLVEKSIKVGVFEFEPLKDNIKENLTRIERLVNETQKMKIGIYVFPEMALTGLSYKSSHYLLGRNPELKKSNIMGAIKDIAKKYKAYIGIGLVDISNDRLYNSYQIFDPYGERVLVYYKNHLFGSDYNWAETGSSYPFFRAKFGNIGVLICHDVVYEESFEDYKMNDVDFLIVGTNWIGEQTIHRHIQKNYKKGTVFISDRKGKEKDTVFYGNTSVIKGNHIIYPTIIANKYRGVIFLHTKST